MSQISSATSSINYTYVSGATYKASYDIWLDPQPRTDGQNATEIMVWFNRQGSIQPIGSVVGTTTIGGRTWEVWRGNPGWNVISYVAPSPITSWSFSVLDFINDVRNRGAIQLVVPDQHPGRLRAVDRRHRARGELVLGHSQRGRRQPGR